MQMQSQGTMGLRYAGIILGTKDAIYYGSIQNLLGIISRIMDILGRKLLSTAGKNNRKNFKA